MSVLAGEALFTACRNIYDMAGENYVLPPLIRDARSLETKSRRTYNFLLEKGDLYFNVELDESCADRNTSPFSKLPLRFHIELHDANRPNRLIELDQSETNELVRAFLLGVKVPIAVEKDALTRSYKISIQLSSTYFVSCGEFVDKGADCTSIEICHSVAHQIYKSSKEFFGTLEEGLAVWSMRAAQDLFGEPKPPPEIFWPSAQRNPNAVLSYRRRASGERTASPYSRYAVAASIIVGLTGVATSVEFSAGASSRPETGAGMVENYPPAPRPERADATVPVKYASVLDSPPVVATAALVVDVDQRLDVPEARGNLAPLFGGPSASSPPPHSSAHAWSAPASAAPAPLARPAEAIRISPKLQSARKPALVAKSDDAVKRRRTANNTTKTQLASPKPDQRNPSCSPKPRPLNPLALVGRTVDMFTRRVVKDLKRIHYRFSSLSER
jgi:hypothetical protein